MTEAEIVEGINDIIFDKDYWEWSEKELARKIVEYLKSIDALLVT